MGPLALLSWGTELQNTSLPYPWICSPRQNRQMLITALFQRSLGEWSQPATICFKGLEWGGCLCSTRKLEGKAHRWQLSLITRQWHREGSRKPHCTSSAGGVRAGVGEGNWAEIKGSSGKKGSLWLLDAFEACVSGIHKATVFRMVLHSQERGGGTMRKFKGRNQSFSLTFS